MRASARLVTEYGLRGLAQLARTALLPVRRMAKEHFGGAGGGLLLGGSALHADLTPETGASGFFGWLLAGIGQNHGWPVPQGGSGALTDALVRRFEHGGGTLLCDAEVEQIEVARGEPSKYTSRAASASPPDGQYWPTWSRRSSTDPCSTGRTCRQTCGPT